MLRVSVVREIFSSRISASARETLKPRATPTPLPTAVALRKVRRCMGSLQLFTVLKPSIAPAIRLVKPLFEDQAPRAFATASAALTYARAAAQTGSKATMGL